MRAWIFGLALAMATALPGAGCTRVTSMPESSQTLAHWQQARNYQARGRYELAKQYYQLALAGSVSSESQAALQREIDAADRMLQTFR